MHDLAQLFHKPLVSEKSTLLEQQGIHTLFVHPRATKTSIKASLQSLYGVKVLAVNIAKNREKFARGAKGGLRCKRGVTIKAYVKLAPGSKLDMTQFA